MDEDSETPAALWISVSYDTAGQSHQPLEAGRVLCTVVSVISFVVQGLLMTAIPREKLGTGVTWGRDI